MYDRHFFSSKLGGAALVSVAAMVTFNIYALTQQYSLAHSQAFAAARVVELA